MRYITKRRVSRLQSYLSTKNLYARGTNIWKTQAQKNLWRKTRERKKIYAHFFKKRVELKKQGIENISSLELDKKYQLKLKESQTLKKILRLNF